MSKITNYQLMYSDQLMRQVTIDEYLEKMKAMPTKEFQRLHVGEYPADNRDDHDRCCCECGDHFDGSLEDDYCCKCWDALGLGGIHG